MKIQNRLPGLRRACISRAEGSYFSLICFEPNLGVLGVYSSTFSPLFKTLKPALFHRPRARQDLVPVLPRHVAAFKGARGLLRAAAARCRQDRIFLVIFLGSTALSLDVFLRASVVLQLVHHFLSCDTHGTIVYHQYIL